MTLTKHNLQFKYNFDSLTTSTETLPNPEREIQTKKLFELIQAELQEKELDLGEDEIEKLLSLALDYHVNRRSEDVNYYKEVSEITNLPAKILYEILINLEI
jgi:hypothetical protein